MSFICIGIIAVGGCFIVPLFGRIQTRIKQLMIIFFKIEYERKKSIIKQIKIFEEMFGEDRDDGDDFSFKK